MTLMKKARDNVLTEEMKIVADKEKVSEKFILEGLSKGTIVIPRNINHKNIDPIGIGRGLCTKVNANIGTSKLKSNALEELEKLNLCIKHKADCVMDLSTGGNLDEIRTELIKYSPLPFGTVPIYQTVEDKGTIEDLKLKDFLDTLEVQAKQGVDFMTIHAGLLKGFLPLAEKRKTGIVSRGGALIARWMRHNDSENPFLTIFDDVLDLALKYDITLSLGDGLRPGCLADATDEAQILELKKLGELTKQAWQKNVQVMIEGPGHVPLDQIKKNMDMQKEYCYGAPFYVLGPIVTDIAPGYDHITCAIGGTLAAYYGASFLCYVTPSEHLCLPNLDDVKNGIIASKIAAHAADVAKNPDKFRGVDDRMSEARKNFDWDKQFELALDADTAKKRRSDIDKDKFCSMCGEKYCAMRVFE